MDMIGIHLRDAIEKGGCPVCRLIEEFEESEIGTILYEHVNDPSLREEFKKSLGLCPYHAWKLLSIAYSNPLYGGLGVAIIYEHMLRTYIEGTQRGETPQESECYLCRLAQEKESLTIDSLADRMAELLPVYEKSEGIFCKRHYEMLQERLGKSSPEVSRELEEIHMRKLNELKKLLNDFIEKFDYRSQESPSDEEALAVRRSIEALKGRPLAINMLKPKKKAGRFPLRGVSFGRRD
jgi:hypothetical protein